MTKRLKEIDINDIMADYLPSDDIFTEDEERMIRIKKIIANDLDDIEKRIIILYAEMMSMRKVAKILGVSASTINICVHDIREKIKKLLTNDIS